MDSEISNNDLLQLFNDGMKISDELRTTFLDTNSIEYQNKVNEGIKLLEDATNLVNELSLFSRNETIEEISTNHLKYLLLPALLADLTVKSRHMDRIDIINAAHVYFIDFIQRLNDYKFCDIDLSKFGKSCADYDVTALRDTDSSLENAARMRNSKIAKYRETKELENRVKLLKEQINASCSAVDDEILRNYYLTVLKFWINQSTDELSSIEMEKPILQHMLQTKNKGNDKHKVSERSDKAPLKPIIITKNELQKKVFGLGYPSIPTVSIDEFVNQKLEEGTLSIANPIYNNSLIDWADNPEKKIQEDELEEANKEKLIENEDSDELRKTREWDDWKDEHRRGEGNRMNMG